MVNVIDRYPGLSKEEAFKRYYKEQNALRRLRMGITPRVPMSERYPGLSPEEAKRRAANDWKKEYRKNPEALAKHKARQILGDAVRSGRIARGPCEVPGCKDTKTEGHHDDYSRPLDVRWLCAKHHKEIH